MKFQIEGAEVYASTGGKEPMNGQPWLIFLHGAGASHLVWSQQSRSFAYGGHNVLALDFPGHHLSQGSPLASVEEHSQWLLTVMDHLKIKTATLVGHSLGGLVALHFAAQHGERTDRVVFVATAAAIPVNDALIENAETTQDKAKSAMTSWGLGPDAHHFDNSVPGFSQVGSGLRTMDLNVEAALPADLKACAAFSGGLDLAEKIDCPSLCVFAGRDRMTPMKFGLKLANALKDNELHVLEHSGHTIPTECPHELNQIMRDFLAK